jgi:hypothetical protein
MSRLPVQGGLKFPVCDNASHHNGSYLCTAFHSANENEIEVYLADSVKAAESDTSNPERLMPN